MSQFDLIEKYLTGNLDEGAKSAFEQEMKKNVQLQSDVNLQRQIIDGIKQARINELKSMLNNVPVSAGFSITAVKLAIVIITAGIVGSVLYFNMQAESGEDMNISTPQETVVEEPATSNANNEVIASKELKDEVQSQKSETPPIIPLHKDAPTPQRPPKVDVIDPTENTASGDEEAIAASSSSRSDIPILSIEVEVMSGNQDYPFHYQFAKGKLFLFGPFDTSLYEIIEINGDRNTHTIFLLYNNVFYHLDQEKSKIAPLTQIRDLNLLDKLEQYRNKK